MGKIKKSGLSQQCRCCLKNIGLKELWTEYYNGDEREVYGEMVNDCFALPWEPLFGKMEHICDSCISRLRDAVTFKKEILYSNQLLNEQAKNVASVKQEEESDMEVGTEYLSIEFLDDSDKDKNLLEIKIEQESKAELTVKEEASASKRGKRYTEDDFKKCIEAVKNGTMSQTKASIVYHVPRKSISAALASSREETVKNPAKATKRAKSEKAKHIDNITTILKYTNATPIRGEKDSRYACCFCEKLFQEPAELKKHNIEEHSSEMETILNHKKLHNYVIKLDITGLKCVLCSLEVDDLEEIIEHLKDHKKVIHTDINSQVFPFNFEGKDLKCAVCKTDFDTFRKLFQHMHTHYSNHTCEICAASFISKRSFDVHYETHKKFDTLSKKRCHELEVHLTSDSQKKEEKPIISKHHDNITTILKYTNATPIGTLNDRGYGCYFCEEFYEKSHELKEHTKDSHSTDFERIMEGKTLSDYLIKLDITGLQCNICKSKILHTMSSLEDMMPHLKGHKKDIHTDIKNQIMPINLKDDEIMCAICQQEFDEFETLIEHMHQHYRNHVCKDCPAGFINEKSYQDHIVFHAKGAFKCKDCDKVFDTFYKKKLHEEIHLHSQKPSKCDICKKTFSFKRNRERHMASVHGKKLREIAARLAKKCVRKR